MATAELQQYPVANNEEDLDRTESIYGGSCQLGPLLAWKEKVDGCRAILKMTSDGISNISVDRNTTCES